MMRKFENIAAKIDFTAKMHGGESCSRLRLDVARKQQSRAAYPILGVDLHGQHERHVVVPPRSVSLVGPQHRPVRATEPDRVAGLHQLEVDASRAHRRKELLDRRIHALRGEK
jgi:hypothetical protein